MVQFHYKTLIKRVPQLFLLTNMHSQLHQITQSIKGKDSKFVTINEQQTFSNPTTNYLQTVPAMMWKKSLVQPSRSAIQSFNSKQFIDTYMDMHFLTNYECFEIVYHSYANEGMTTLYFYMFAQYAACVNSHQAKQKND